MGRLLSNLLAASALAAWILLTSGAAADLPEVQSELPSMPRVAGSASGEGGLTSEDTESTRLPAGSNPACGEGAGRCDQANGSPGCEDVTCCNSVCALDPFCCDVFVSNFKPGLSSF